MARLSTRGRAVVAISSLLIIALVAAGVVVVVSIGRAVGDLVGAVEDVVATAPTTPGSTPSQEPSPSSPVPSATPRSPVEDPGTAVEDPASIPGKYRAALSEPRKDSAYPEVGDPGVDALHYGLDLTWDRDAEVLSGRARVTFRATADASSVTLDLGEPLRVRSARLDGATVRTDHDGTHLVVHAPVKDDAVHTLVVDYRGTPQPVAAPSTRSDMTGGLGWTVDPRGQVWTMQEPYGAHTWYPVNDHPSDKAFYDITVRAPRGWVGIANGALRSRKDTADATVTRWSLASPASSYLTTIAIGDYRQFTAKAAGGRVVSLWAAPGSTRAANDVRVAADALDWLESRLGEYPFETLGFVVVDSDSAMETQTMITMGDTEYALEPATFVHELAHQWYGDLVTPTDWRDVWMNEGMATYLQVVWESQHGGYPLEAHLALWRMEDGSLRADAGPPAAFDPEDFGVNNVYTSPALMWHDLRGRLGDDAFWRIVRDWPRVHDLGHATRTEYLAWVEKRADVGDLDPFFDAWLLGETTPH
ncbi:M1 family metallopeptidase [Janibacter sp. G1551]|uniref:M1 family metallopeptidase n=1 Tax=Janibacter sp. G1551 TaxID=3420440 RepID=UPI003D07B655